MKGAAFWNPDPPCSSDSLPNIPVAWINMNSTSMIRIPLRTASCPRASGEIQVTRNAPAVTTSGATVIVRPKHRQVLLRHHAPICERPPACSE